MLIHARHAYAMLLPLCAIRKISPSFSDYINSGHALPAATPLSTTTDVSLCCSALMLTRRYFTPADAAACLYYADFLHCARCYAAASMPMITADATPRYATRDMMLPRCRCR